MGAITVSSRRKNKLTFFLSISTLHSLQWAAIPEMMCGFIGVDVSCQSNIRGMGNWQWRWWGNPHTYISADKGAVTTSLPLFLPQPFLPSKFLSLSLTTSLMLSPWNFPFSSHTKVFYVSCLSCSGYTCLPSFSSTGPFGSELCLIYSSGGEQGGEGLRQGCLTHSSSVWPWSSSTGAVEELITLFIDF